GRGKASPQAGNALIMKAHFCLFPIALILLVVGCRNAALQDGAPDVKLSLNLTPQPPTVGKSTVVIQLADVDGKPVTGATLKLEANMTHAGMQPVFADVRPTDTGRYEANFEFTMGGDWFLLVTGTLADSRKFQRKVDVPGVKAR